VESERVIVVMVVMVVVVSGDGGGRGGWDGGVVAVARDCVHMVVLHIVKPTKRCWKGTATIAAKSQLCGQYDGQLIARTLMPFGNCALGGTAVVITDHVCPLSAEKRNPGNAVKIVPGVSTVQYALYALPLELP
jgi:hypothetical protein